MANIGDMAKDVVSGFMGRVTGRAEYLYGPPVVRIEALSLSSDGQIVENWLPEAQVMVVEEPGATD